MTTPAPWEIDTSITSYAAAIRHKWNGGVKTICYVEGPGLSASSERRRSAGIANAMLIAAAPDLLEALQEVVAISNRKHDAWDKAHAAIAKALGNSVI